MKIQEFKAETITASVVGSAPEEAAGRVEPTATKLVSVG